MRDFSTNLATATLLACFRISVKIPAFSVCSVKVIKFAFRASRVQEVWVAGPQLQPQVSKPGGRGGHGGLVLGGDDPTDQQGDPGTPPWRQNQCGDRAPLPGDPHLHWLRPS